MAHEQASRRRGAPLIAVLALLSSVLVLPRSQHAGAVTPGSAAFVQGTTFDTGSNATSLSVSLGQGVGAGDLLVGWFAQYRSAGNVQVSDNVNGVWTRAPSSVQFGGSAGDIALYYFAGAKAASGGVTVTISTSATAEFQGTVAEYSGVAGSLVAMSVSRGSTAAVNSGSSASAAAGDLVYAAEVTGQSPGSVPSPGSSDGVAYTERASTSNGSAFEEDILAGGAGAQTGTATLAQATDWYAVVATFAPATSPSPTPTPTPTPSSGALAKVLVIMDENQSDLDVFPSTSHPAAQMPYLWSLAQKYGYATNWSDIGHPSEVNYLAIFAGSAEGNPSDCAPGPGCEWAGPTLFSQAIGKGDTAKTYEETMPTNCDSSYSGDYDRDHNPWIYFDDPTDQAECAAYDVSSGTTSGGNLLDDIVAGTLPNVGLLKPNLANDGTDGTASGFATADDWLQGWISAIMSGPDWQSGDLGIVVTFDESDEGAGGENVPFVLIAPSVGGAQVTTALNHYALTRFIDEVIGAAPLQNAASATDIAPLFGVTVGS